MLGWLAASLLTACAGAGAGPSTSDVSRTSPPSAAVVVTSTTTTTTTTVGASTTIVPAITTTTTTTAPRRQTTTTTRAAPRQTRCRALTHIGDSITIGMTSEELAPDARLDAQYTRIGVRERYIDASGGRSIVETLPDQVNAYDTAVAQRSAGFTGCWVLELGTNDAANVAHGSLVDPATRIDRMMSVIGSDPVLWVDVISRIDRGDYASENMQMWDAALEAARVRYPNMHVFAWASVAQAEWFRSDGLHYTTAGYTTLAHSLADAVTATFPA